MQLKLLRHTKNSEITCILICTVCKNVSAPDSYLALNLINSSQLYFLPPFVPAKCPGSRRGRVNSARTGMSGPGMSLTSRVELAWGTSHGIVSRNCAEITNKTSSRGWALGTYHTHPEALIIWRCLWQKSHHYFILLSRILNLTFYNFKGLCSLLV